MACTRADVDIHFEVVGPIDGPTVVLVAGLGEQIGSVEFPAEQCALFVERGFRVVRMDNRDNGLSVFRAQSPDGGPDAVPVYSFFDMADDVAAVIDASGASMAHVVGASMGGYIARWTAVRHPDKIASLTLVMSPSGAYPGEAGPQMAAEVVQRLRDMLTVRRQRDDAITAVIDMWRWLWGTHYGFDEVWVRDRVTHAYDRSYRPEGVARNLLAGISAPGLWEAQHTIQCPTLVLHGDLDPCLDVDHAQAIASQIPGSTLWVEPGMGHTMHPELWNSLVDRLEERP